MKSILTFFLILISMGVVEGVEPAATVHLASTFQSSEAEIRLGQIAKITCSDTNLAEKLRKLQVGRTPFAGQVLTLNQGLVLLRIKTAQIPSDKIKLTGAPTTKITREAGIVHGDEIIATAEAEVQSAWSQTGVVTTEVVQRPADATVPTGTVELRARVSGNARPGMVTVPVDVLVDGVRSRTINVTLRVSVMTPVVVANQPLARGQLIEASMLAVEDRDLGRFGADTFTDVSLVAGQKATRTIQTGGVIRKSDLQIIPLVHRNGPVVIRSGSGRITVSANGVALEEGQLGQLVRVRPQYSKETITAKVTGEGAVEIAL